MTEVIRPQGPLTMETANAHAGALDAMRSASAITVDLSGVTEADSSAVALLLAWCRIAQSRQQPLRIQGVPDGLRSLIAVYGVAELLPLGE